MKKSPYPSISEFSFCHDEINMRLEVHAHIYTIISTRSIKSISTEYKNLSLID